MSQALEQFIGTQIGHVKSLGWFGFAADPPALAHRDVVDAALGSGLVEKVIVFPAGELSYKTFQASDWQRSDMVELWKSEAQWGDEVVISRFDMLRDRAILWIELWDTLQRIAPKIEHYLIVGSDQYEAIGEIWSEGERLLAEASFIIVPRLDFAIGDTLPHHHRLDIDPIPGSSTDARGGALEQVDPRVKAYILENQLYQAP